MIALLLWFPFALGASGLALPPDLAALRTAGWDAAYRTDYRTARAKFNEFSTRAPAHPDSDLCLAAITWQEHLFNTRRLQTQIYRGDSDFYSRARGSKESDEGDKVDDAVASEFERHVSRAIANAQRAADANPKDADALYVLGASYALRAAYEATAERRFWAALRDGLRAVKLHQKVIRADPRYHDAYLSIGLYHYAVGRIPQPFRAIATVAGVRGSRDRGIAELELAKKNGTYNRDDASTVLAALYLYEGKPRRAESELETLSRRYPENLLLRLERASLLAQLGETAQATDIFDELLRSSDRRIADLIHYRYGEALASRGNHEAASEHFVAASREPEAYPGLVAAALVKAGQMYDLRGRRPEAIEMYRASLAHPGSGDVRKKAERLIQRPFRQK